MAYALVGHNDHRQKRRQFVRVNRPGSNWPRYYRQSIGRNLLNVSSLYVENIQLTLFSVRNNGFVQNVSLARKINILIPGTLGSKKRSNMRIFEHFFQPVLSCFCYINSIAMQTTKKSQRFILIPALCRPSVCLTYFCCAVCERS